MLHQPLESKLSHKLRTLSKIGQVSSRSLPEEKCNVVKKDFLKIMAFTQPLTRRLSETQHSPLKMQPRGQPRVGKMVKLTRYKKIKQ